MAEFDTVIRGGTLATASDLFTADLGIANGKISVIGMNLGRLPPRSTHSSHARAAILAALSPAGPAPTTSTSTLRRIGASAGSGASGFASRGGAERTSLPLTTFARQALCSGLPSIVTKHSKHVPMPHHRPRGAPERVRRSVRMPAAVKAAATLSPSSAGISRPSKRMATRSPVWRTGLLSSRRVKSLSRAISLLFLSALPAEHHVTAGSHFGTEDG